MFPGLTATVGGPVDVSSHAGPGVSALWKDESGPPVLCAFSVRVPDPLGGQLWA